MFRFLLKYFFSFCFLVFCLNACNNQPPKNKNSLSARMGEENDGSTDNEDEPFYDEDPIAENFKNGYRTRKVSAFRLEDRDFQVMDVSVGLKEYIDSETIYVTFKLPRAADYAEILRCREDVIFDAGQEIVNFKDIALNGISERQRDSMYRGSDVFVRAAAENGCEYITRGSPEENISDPWASTGSYVYIIVPCVSPQRMVHTEDLTSRNCSRRFAVSHMVDYVNERKKDSKEALKKAGAIRDQLLGLVNDLAVKASQYEKAVTKCDHDAWMREVNKAHREAVVFLVASTAEIILELATAQMGTSKKTGKPKKRSFKNMSSHYALGGNKMDTAQLIQAAGGFSFSQMFNDIFADVQDMPRTCTESEKKKREMDNIGKSVVFYKIRMEYYNWKADLLQKGMGQEAGLDVPLPTIEEFNANMDYVAPDEQQAPKQEDTGE